MSKLFCVSPGLRVLERQMQQPPGYRPRGYGMVVDASYSKGKVVHRNLFDSDKQVLYGRPQ